MNFTKSHCKSIVVIFFLAGIFTSGCVQVEKQESNERGGYTDEERIDLLIKSLYLAKGPNYYANCQEIANYGEKALPLLGEGVSNRLWRIRLGCIFTIGEIYQQTKSEKALGYKESIGSRLKDVVQAVRLEAARTLLEMRDYRGVPILIEALTDKNPYVRMNACYSLQNAFNITFRYHHNAPDKVREQRARRWEDWWVKNRAKYLRVSS